MMGKIMKNRVYQQQSKSIFLSLLCLFLSIFTIGCDKNIARPEELAQLTSVSISELSVGDDTLIIGESTTISWSVTDSDDIVQAVEITPDIGTVTKSDTRQITPSATTVYTLNVYSGGEVVKSRSVSVKVLDESGDEIEDVDASVSEIPETETSCTDGEDNDEDGDVDCDDSECSEDEACVEPTYEFTSTSHTPQEPLIGDTITVSWVSTFDKVIVYEDGVLDPKIYGAEDSYEFTADAETEIVLQGLVGGGIYDSASLEITATEEPVSDFSEDVEVLDFSASPSQTLIYGQPYTVSWDVENASDVKMDNNTEHSGYDEYTAYESTTHTLDITDASGITDERELPITVSAFESTGGVIDSDITKMVAYPNDETIYFISDSKIYSYDYDLGSQSEITTSGINGTIHSIAANSEKIFIGTTQGVYVKASGDSSFTEIATTGGTLTVTALSILGDGAVLAGTDEMLYVLPECEEDEDDGYCVQLMSFAGRHSKSDYNADEVNFIQFIKNPSDSSHIIAITNAGVYESTDDGTSFSNQVLSVTNITGGYWDENGGYLWTSSDVYKWTGSTFAKDATLSKTSNIKFVSKSGDYTFIATTSGVQASYNGETVFNTNHTSSAKYLIPGENVMTAIDASGNVDVISWSESQTTGGSSSGLSRIFGGYFFSR